MVTLDDIVEKTKLSKTTVSFALRGKGTLKKETRERVLQAAQTLGYRPNMLITGMRSGKTKNVGVILNDPTDFRLRSVYGISIELEKHDNLPLVAFLRDNCTTEDLLYKMIDRRVDGLIFRAEHIDSTYSNLNEILKRNIPVVLLEQGGEMYPQLDIVHTDDILGGEQAAQYLIEMGHRKLGFLGCEWIVTSRKRRQGFERVVAQTMNAQVVYYSIEKDSFKAALELLSSPDRPEAVFCYNDHHVYNLYKAAKELGISIPEDISVIGFADLNLGIHITPNLTTVRQFPEKEGELAASLLMARIDNMELPKQTAMVPPELIIRDSVKYINK